MPLPTKTPIIDWTKPESWPENWWSNVPKKIGSVIPISSFPAASSQGMMSIFDNPPKGYGTFAAQQQKWQMENYRWQYAVGLNSMKTGTQAEPSMGWFPSQIHGIVSQFELLQRTMAGLVGKTPAGVAPKNIYEAPITDPTIIANNWKRSAFMSAFYGIIESMVKTDKVKTFDDYLRISQMNPQDYHITAADQNEIESAITRLTLAPAATLEEQKLTEFLTTPQVIRITPQLPHVITVQEIIKSLTTGGATAVAPDEAAAQDYLDLAKTMGIPDDYKAELAIFETQLEPYFASAREQAASVDAVMKGLAEWKMPDVSLWQQLQFAAARPMQEVADFIQKTIGSNFADPIAGLGVYIGQRLFQHTPQVDTLFEQYKSQGIDPWHALGSMYQDYTLYDNGALNTIGKMTYSAIADPLTWWPGWGLSVPGNLLVKGGTKLGPNLAGLGFKTFGEELLSVNRWMWHVTNIPFDGFRGMLDKLPLATKEVIKREGDNLSNILIAGSTDAGKVADKLTATGLVDHIEASVVAFGKTPKGPGLLVSAGRFFHVPATLEPDAIVAMGKKLGMDASKFKLGGVQVVSDSMIGRVNDLVKGAIQKTIPIEQATVDLLREFGIPKTLANLNKASKMLLDLTKETYTSRISILKQIAKEEGSTANDVLKAARGQQTTLAQDYFKSRYALTQQRQGIMQAIVNGVDALDRAIWRRTIDRLWNTPFAMAYIANFQVLIGNVFGEPQLVQMLEGIRPGFGHTKTYLTISRGLLAPTDLTREAMERTGTGEFGFLAGAVGTKGQRAIVPSKGWPAWLGTNLIKTQNSAGYMIRIDSWSKLWEKYFAERLRVANLLPGVDIPKAVTDATRNVPALPKGFGLKSATIVKDTQLAFMNNITQLQEVAKELIENYSPTNILRGQIEKLIKNESAFSIDTKTKLFAALDETDVLGSLDNINKLASDGANWSLTELKQAAWNRSEAFKDLADAITSHTIETPTQLADVLATYGNIVTTAKKTIQDLIKSVADEADDAALLKRYGKISKIWRGGIANIGSEKDAIWHEVRRIQTQLQDSVTVLTPKQRLAADKFLSDLDAEINNASDYLLAHYNRTEALWSTIRTEHPEGAELEALHYQYRKDQMALREAFNDSDAALSSHSLASRLDSAKAILELPKQTTKIVNVSGRPISPVDIAQMSGCMMEDVYRNLVESFSMQGKKYFVEMFQAMADSRPRQFIGFTREKLGEVYDHIVQNIGIRPAESGAEFEIRKAAENLKMELIDLKMKKSMVFDMQPRLAEYFTNAANKMQEGIKISKGAKAAPQITLSTGSPIAGTYDVVASIGKKDLGVITYSEGNNYFAILTIKVKDEYKRLGAGSKLIRDAIDKAESFKKPLLSGTVGDEGELLLRGMEKKGVIILTEPAEEFKGWSKYAISRGPKFTAAPESVGGITKQSWDSLRQLAADDASRTYNQMFADYNNTSILGTVGRMFFPYWKYNSYRWTWLARTAVRHPGTVDAWSRFYENTDQGRFGIGGDLAFGALAGTVLGPLFQLARQDYASYYEDMGPLSTFVDNAQRWAFSPNPLIMTAAYLSPMLSGQKPELGSLLPGLYKAGLSALILSQVPGVSDAAKKLQDTIFHDNFRDYYKAMMVNEKQLRVGGTLAGGVTGTELWEKIKTKLPLTPEEQVLWDSTEQDVALLSLVRSEFAYISYSPTETRTIQANVDKIYEAYGFTPAQMKYMREHGIRPSDIMGGMPLDIRQQLDQMWQWKFVGGASEMLAPPSIQDTKIKVSQYWSDVGTLSDRRLAEEIDAESRFLHPTGTTKPLTPSDFKSEHSSIWDRYNTSITDLNTINPKYKDEEFQLMVSNSPEGIALLIEKTGGYAPYQQGPMDTLISFWYDVQVENRTNPHTGETEPDYLMYTLKRQAVLDAVPPELQPQFLDWVHKNSTPLELKRDEIMNQYIRGYQRITDIVYGTYDEESQALIDEFYSGGVTRERKEEIQQEIDPKTGRKLISAYSSALTTARQRMRDLSPTLDFWLYVFGYISQPRTDTAKLMVDNWEKDRTSILK